MCIRDRRITKPGRERGVVFQEHALFPWLTIKNNILFGLKLRNVAKQEQEEELDKYLDMMGLTRFKDSFPKELSGGMRQRTSIARALINKPRTLLMEDVYKRQHLSTWLSMCIWGSILPGNT